VRELKGIASSTTTLKSVAGEDVEETFTKTIIKSGMSAKLSAFTKCKIKPDPLRVKQWLEEIQLSLANYSITKLTIIIRSMASLAIKPNSRFFAAWCQAYLGHFQNHDKGNKFISVIYSMLLLDKIKKIHKHPISEFIAILRSINPSEVTKLEDKQKLLMINTVLHHKKTTLFNLGNDGFLIEWRKEICKIRAASTTSSSIHNEVSRTLKQMGIVHKNEFWLEKIAVPIDIVVPFQTKALCSLNKIAIQIDGCFHFYKNENKELTSEATSATVLNTWVIKYIFNYKLIRIDTRDWVALKDLEQKECFLKKLLKEAADKYSNPTPIMQYLGLT
jgi:hypothetical protein